MDNHLTESLRLSLPSVLAENLNGQSPQFGKTVFMKLAYLLQEVYKVPLEYRFTLYTYGPYSTEVLADLDRAKLRGWVNVNFVDNDGGFRITPGSRASGTAGTDEVLSNYQCQINQLVETFGQFRAKDLELRTTIIYVSNMMEVSDKSATDEVAKAVHQLKPHFSESEIQKAANELACNVRWTQETGQVTK